MSALSPIFTKYHGNGNDFVIFDMTKTENASSRHYLTNAASHLCRRHDGIGADGVILLDREQDQFLMTVINADGSVAKNCGNGLRCAAAYIFGQTNTLTTVIELSDRIFHCQKGLDDISVLMGECYVEEPLKIYLENAGCYALFSRVDVGNEHAVFLIERPVDVSVALVNEVLSKYVEKKGVNIGFLYKDPVGLNCSKVFEAGVGFTRSCGSGASAAACVLALCDDTNLAKEIPVIEPGGEVYITVKDKMSTPRGARFFVSLRGKVVEVFTGICAPSSIARDGREL